MTLYTENKDSIINRIPSLTPEQKKQLVEYFGKHPEAESKIQWNQWKTLTFRDFESALKHRSKSELIKNVKSIGIEGLIEGSDYVTCYRYPYITPGTANTGIIMGFCPLHWEASKMIASPYVGDSKTEGEWCVAYSKDPGYWNDMVGNEGSHFIYFIDYNPDSKWGKVAVRIFNKKKYDVWNSVSHRIYSSGGYLNASSDYPEFLFEPEKMFPIIIIAINNIENAGGETAEKTKMYEITCNIYGEVDSTDDTHFEGSVSFEQMSYTDGDDYDREDQGDETTSSNFIIDKIGKGYKASYGQYTDFNNFNAMNGVGLVITYDGDYTPDEAYSAANRKWITVQLLMILHYCMAVLKAS